MNIPKCFELALSRCIRAYGDLPSNVTLRPWQSLTDDATWDSEQDRTFPMVEFRASPPAIDGNQSTMTTSCVILCGEMADDDRDHSVISDLYQRVWNVIYAIYAQFRTGIDGTEKTAFDTTMSELAGAAYNFGGFTIAEGLAPYDDKGVNMIGITFVLHYSTDDF